MTGTIKSVHSRGVIHIVKLVVPGSRIPSLIRVPERVAAVLKNMVGARVGLPCRDGRYRG